MNTCYHRVQSPSSDIPVNSDPLKAAPFPSILDELGGLVDQIGNRTMKTQARAALENFDVRSKKATNYMNMGQLMLRDAHKEVVHNLRTILEASVNGNIGDLHYHPTSCAQGTKNKYCLLAIFHRFIKYFHIP